LSFFVFVCLVYHHGSEINITVNVTNTVAMRRLRPVGKLHGGNQATVISLAVGETAAAGSTGSCAVTGSKDRCLKVRIEELLLMI